MLACVEVEISISLRYEYRLLTFIRSSGFRELACPGDLLPRRGYINRRPTSLIFQMASCLAVVLGRSSP